MRDKKQSIVCCIKCRKECIDIKSFQKHYKKRHVKIVKTDLSSEYRAEKIAEINADLKNRRSLTELKAALREQLADSPLDQVPAYNVDVYRLAIRTLPQGEAYKIAKDASKSAMFLAEYNNINSIHNSTYLDSNVEDIYINEISSQSESHEVDYPTDDVVSEAIFKNRVVKTRVNQSDFSNRVAANFYNKCAVTGSGGLTCHAAHIDPVSSGNNNTSNGLYIISCLHILFDLGFMAINPTDMTVHFKNNTDWFASSLFEGKTISVPKIAINIRGLEKRWAEFNSN
ncbi:HNH endonuclease [Enterobacter ludwigii]|uniref:HNH endonuclease n=1 Tax=Enterobacter ludwigii TaxID=299767 RepID=A0AAX3LEU1_9ENTR|nr:HNH endonuclease [Enterobacter ludwigii]KUQ41686.1 hypothetical protein AWI16_17930 [Enterobacter ludwigii]MBX8912225.1 HNH endonuclease [Enterobacter ludwigii]MCM7782393.1 HNH endonuclease [Enterobacter ludwigii]RTO53447.1 HNH endonuclease [Enterobacter ludwigii]WCE14843.1 HNH endonuclease [Enterobacter ludwigii]